MKAALQFIAGWVRDPRRVGAIAPASSRLATIICEEVRRSGAQWVIEVGPGTGAITQLIYDDRLRYQRIVAVERDHQFARRLAQAYPGIEVFHRCVSDIEKLPLDHAGPLAIISSLPLRSMQKHEAERCILALTRLLMRHDQSRLIQYTYSPSMKGPWLAAQVGLSWRRVGRVWSNLPPATVWSLARHR